MMAHLRRMLLYGAGLLLSSTSLFAAEPPPWTDKDTRLASEYLGLLAEKPEYGRVLDLLWDLYDKHQSTALLLESIAAQAQSQEQSHPGVTLVQAHLLRKAGRWDDAAGLYQKVLQGEPRNAVALRALADLSLEQSKRDVALGYLKRLTDTLAENDPRRAPLFLEQGRVMLELEQPAAAATAWEQAVRLQPGNTALAREAAQLLLGAGFVDKALALYRELAKTSDPARKVDALYDLSRLEEQADHLPQAAAALREGMALLHFRDWRYAQFFQRLVKLHERFGQLDALKASLLEAAGADPPREKALADMAKFAELTVDGDERVRWLRELVRRFPEVLDYQLQLVHALVDHEGWQEAGVLLERQFKNDGSDPPTLVLLRCLVHLRAGEDDQAAARIRRLLRDAGGSPEVEKQVLAFTREKSLDDVTEEILQARVKRDPSGGDAVMELAAFYRSRQRSKEMQQLLDRYASRADAGQAGRLNQVAAFLAGGSDTEAAEKAARDAVRSSRGGREELLRLADVVSQNGASGEALALLERAWQASENFDKRADVDERILALLSGEPAAKPLASPSSTEFKLPAIFTGEGFGSDAPASERRKTVADAVVDFAMAQAAAVAVSGLDWRARQRRLPGPGFLREWQVETFTTVAGWFPRPSPQRALRAAWWCFRAELTDLAYVLLLRPEVGGGSPAEQVPVEAQKLWLDLALSDRNTLLAVRQLRLLSVIDPGNRTTYQLRLAEQEMARDGGGGRPEALRILESLSRDEPQNEAVLSALAQCYLVENRREDVLALWEKAVRGARGNVVPLLERQAEALVAQRRFKEFVAVQARLLEEETDLKRRRENFQRALERLQWADSTPGESGEDERRNRLELAVTVLRERAQRHPFDGFWHEALAQVYDRQGDAAKAFAEMKQAYYTAPDTPFSLDQLRAAALRAGDMRNAIYFQKQIAAAAASRDEAGEWRELVQLLEQDFRTAEADGVRRRLEARFSQDAAALDELAKYYTDSAQEEAARRVFAQIARVRPWDAGNLLRLTLARKRLGETKAALESLGKLLWEIPPPADNVAKLPVERMPWPVLDERKPGPVSLPALLAVMENAPGLETSDREALRVFLSMPRDELAEVPDDAGHVRLRALEELARLGGAVPDLDRLSEIERAWWLFYSGAGAEFRALLAPRFAGADSFEARFLFLWLVVRSHGMADAVAWARAEGPKEDEHRRRSGLLLAVVNILAEGGGFEFARLDLETLGGAGLWSSAELIDIARKLETRRRHDDALVLGEAALRQMSQPDEVLLHSLANIAGSAGRTEDERRYYEELWRRPLQAASAKGYTSAGARGVSRNPEDDLLWYYERVGHAIEAAPPRPNDGFLLGLGGLLRLARSPAEREELLGESWRRLHQFAPSAPGTLRQARVLGLAGADEAGAERLAKGLGDDLLTARSFLEPIAGRLPPGLPAPGPRIDEVNHMRGYWDELREWGAALSHDGLAAMFGTAEHEIARRLGGTPLGPRTNADFNAWRMSSLARRLREADYLERVRLVREQLAADDSVEMIIELGGQLEAQGYMRECVELYGRLHPRAPSNAEYSENFVRVCEASWDVVPAMPYLERLFDPAVDPVFKPLTINFEVLREKHAKFLSMLHDNARLRQLSFRDAPAVKLGRIPEQVPYLREFGLLLEREGDSAGALAAWEQLAALWPEDQEAALHRAQILAMQGNRARALEALRKMPAANFWNEHERKGLELRARLAAEAGSTDELRELMNLVTTPPSRIGTASPFSPGGSTAAPKYVNAVAVAALARALSDHQRAADAQSLLVRGERTVRDDSDRFRLRLAQLRLAGAEPGWDPRREAARIAALLRLEPKEESLLGEFRDWMTQEGKSTRVDAWFVLLNGSSPAANVTLALAALGRAGGANETHFMRGRLHAGPALRLAAETLVAQGESARALQLVESPSPLAVRAHGALRDNLALADIFARVVRMEFPGGAESVEYAEAFAACGRKDLADELYGLALRRLHATAQTLPALVKSYASFLVAQKRFEQAETMLLREHQGITQGLAEILVDLYRGWNRLEHIDRELAKFYLPGGVLEEARFLAARTAKRNP